MKNLSRLRFPALCILGAAVLSAGTVVLGQLASNGKSKIVIYPSANESISQMRELGISHAVNYGSYWLVEATDDQVASVKAKYGTRVMKADYMNRVELNVCEIDVTQGEPSDIPSSLRESVISGNRLRLVQFNGPVKPQWLKQLQGVGDVKIVSYMPNNAYVVWLDAAAESNLHSLTVSNGPVQWIGAYHPFYKAKPSLLHTTNAVVEVTVELVDTPQLPQTVSLIRGLCSGGKCGEPIQIDGKIQIRATLPATMLLQVVRLPDVLWVQQVVPMRHMDERQAIVLATSNTGPSPARYLNFLNTVGFTNDPTQYPILDIADTGLDEPSETTGIYPWHPCFYDPSFPVSPDAQCAPSGRLRVMYYYNSDTEGHGTIVASVAAGFDTNGNETIHCYTQSNDVVSVTNIDVVAGTTNVTSETVCVIVSNRPSPPFPATIIRRQVIGTQTNQCGLGVSPYGRIGSSPGGAETNYPGPLPAGLTAYLNGARISNNSWGEVLTTDADGNVVNGGTYDDYSVAYDSLVRDSVQTGSTNPPTPGYSPVNQELFYVFAGGNANGSDSTAGGFGDIVVTPPATAKNIIAVGASTLGGAISSFSSFGPCEDGRFKPDIVAPGEDILGATSQATYIHPICDGCDPNNPNPLPNCDDVLSSAVITRLYSEVDNGLTAYSGTSFSAPAVSGGAQLLWWYFQHHLHMLPPSPAMLKAYLCNSALYLPIIDPLTGAQDTLPSIAQGMGRMDLARMFDGVSRVLRDETTPRAIDTPLLGTNAVSQQTFFSQSGQTYELKGTVADQTKPFRVTLAWTDAPGNLAAFKQLVNDLNLKVTIGGQLYLGNVFAGPNSTTTNAILDQVNNMESVFLPAGQTGAWSVVVQAQHIAGAAVPNVKESVINQDFALVVYNGTNASDVSTGLTNDTCQTAIQITTFPFSWTNTLSSPTYVNAHPSPSAGPGGLKEFFKIVRPLPGTIIGADTIGSGFPTEVSIWEGQCGALFELTSAAPTLTIPPVTPPVSWTVMDTNSTYYIVAEGLGGATGHLVLNVNARVPAIGFIPPSLDFGAAYPPTTTAPQIATYTNGSTLAVHVTDISLMGANLGDFHIVANQCAGATVPPGGICQIELTFQPTTNGTRTAALSLSSDTTGASQSLPLSGTGLMPIPLVCLSAGTLTFGGQFVGTTSLVQSVVVSNCGAAALDVTNHVLFGANPADFIVTNNCEGGSILTGGVCTVGISFAPSTNGARAATLTLYDNGLNNPHSIGLSGTGTIPTPGVCFSTNALNFGNVQISSNTIQTLTITNCGTVALLITNVTFTGANAAEFRIVGDTCSSNSVSTGATCSITVEFAPTSGGTHTASLVIFDNAPSNSQTISLNGSSVTAFPDASIGTSTSLKKFIGKNVLDPTGLSQIATNTIRNGKKKVFYIAIQNRGTQPDSFVVSGAGSNSNFVVKCYLGTTSKATDITDLVVGGTFTTSSMSPGTITAKSAMIRMEIQAFNVFTGMTHDVPVTVSSVSAPSVYDKVIAHLQVK